MQSALIPSVHTTVWLNTLTLSLPQFMAVYDYTPCKLSTVTRPRQELSFRTGDIIITYGPPGTDGFYYGKVKSPSLPPSFPLFLPPSLSSSLLPSLPPSFPVSLPPSVLPPSLTSSVHPPLSWSPTISPSVHSLPSSFPHLHPLSLILPLVLLSSLLSPKHSLPGTTYFCLSSHSIEYPFPCSLKRILHHNHSVWCHLHYSLPTVFVCYV